MKAVIVIEIDENHLIKETNELYDRLKGYKCDLRSLPQEKDVGYPNEDYDVGFGDGWNACLEEIIGETE